MINLHNPLMINLNFQWHTQKHHGSATPIRALCGQIADLELTHCYFEVLCKQISR